jgi:uncharacterized protein YggE
LSTQSNPDVIVITAKHEALLEAERAELRVVVQGSSLITGRAALRKAKEVSKLVQELALVGIGEGQIRLEGVQAEVSSGLLGKSSSASYTLRIHCDDLEQLADVLGAVTQGKNARLEQIVWRYPDSAEQQAVWLGQCIARANTRAFAAAAALGTRIVGVHRLSEERLDEESPQRGAPQFAAISRARTASVDLGFELSEQKRALLRVVIEYLIEGFEPHPVTAQDPR